jgi:hypothetical protein
VSARTEDGPRGWRAVSVFVAEAGPRGPRRFKPPLSQKVACIVAHSRPQRLRHVGLPGLPVDFDSFGMLTGTVSLTLPRREWRSNRTTITGIYPPKRLLPPPCFCRWHINRMLRRLVKHSQDNSFGQAKADLIRCDSTRTCGRANVRVLAARVTTGPCTRQNQKLQS